MRENRTYGSGGKEAGNRFLTLIIDSTVGLGTSVIVTLPAAGLA